MELLDIPSGKLPDNKLKELAERCKAAHKKLKGPDSEVRLPIIIEFSGSPKSGKTTIIGIVAHFLKRMKIKIEQPVEGASLRTPPGLRDDLMSFNTWSGCYALQEILIRCSDDPSSDIVILDRGLFDVLGWMEHLHSSEGRLAAEDLKRINEFFTLDLWLARENAVFLFTADHKTSLARENQDKLTKETGMVMNAGTLRQLHQAYENVAKKHSGQFGELYHVDTSFVKDKSPSFQNIAYLIAEKIVCLMENISTQTLLVTKPVVFEGINTKPDVLDATVSQIINKNAPVFLDREKAEKAKDVQQIVPYALLKNEENKFFWAQRHSKARRKGLQSKYTILVGGHAEERDWNPNEPGGIFEQCLRRELEEELIGLKILKVEPVGFINDTRNEMGSHHLAFIHKVRVGGRTLIRRQAIDQEFGRESVSWKSADEIKHAIDDLDPWSQLVAAELFDAELPRTNLFA